ncbi:IclR family transcriptional regulator [Pseudaminobacter salicylatoxidans]|uniref:IclR family transcriptional regulator n=1 Tax=Pseudaminobacter salicylatoxidans TaxID=93369 RepID=A0A316C1L1_PSESE|nr:IclR family transcriptional regulator [Pseudaminobacter salicylatoxidans]PWJ82343.1 IclR family transcriptional regulator [Pseudaminobacter salicylatoxidans]
MNSKKTTEDRYRAPALDKGLDILELLSSQPHGLTRAEIVKAMGRGPSEIYRMLERLVARDYVSRSIEGDRYALTMKLFMLGSQHPPLRRLSARALPLMDQFARATHQSIHLVAPERGYAIVVAQASSPAHWEFRLRTGAQLDLLTTGSGQTLLAFQSPDRRHETLAIWGSDAQQRHLAELEPVLEEVRGKGYRIGDSLQLVGVRDISVPVFAPSGDALAVLTCPYFERLDDAQAADVKTALAHLQDVSVKLSIA